MSPDDQVHEYDPNTEDLLAHYMHVGRLVSACTGLEHAVQQLHETLLRTPLFQITNGEGFEAARQGALHAAAYYGGQTDANVRAAMKEAKEVWDLRGELVHGHSTPGDESGKAVGSVSVARVRRAGTTKRVWEPGDVDQVYIRAHAIWQVVEELYLSLPQTDILSKGFG